MGHGGFEQLSYRSDLPCPVPQSDEVLIRVRAAAVNNTDINMRIGWYSKSVTDATSAVDTGGSSAASAEDAGWTGSTLNFPRIQGADACGHIVAVGEGVAAERIGERVLIDPVFRFPGGDPIYFGSDCPGGFAEYTCAPAVNVHAIDSPMSDAELASFPCSYTAAENMLARAQVGAGETILVTGASGGVGSAAVQLAVCRGAKVIALAGAGKEAEIHRLGAAQVLPREADLRALMPRESIDAVIDVVGGPGFPALLDILRRGGRYAVSGAISGPLVELDLRTLYLKDLRLHGCTIPEPSVFRSLLGYIERGEIRSVVARSYPLASIAEAQREFLRKRHVGKIVLEL